MPFGLHIPNTGVISATTSSVNFATLFGTSAQFVQTDRGLTYGSTLLTTGVSQPTLTLSGSLVATNKVPITVTCTLGGALGVWTGSISYNGGATVAQNFTSAATITLTGAGAGLTLSINGTAATLNNVWQATCSNLADQSGNGLNYIQPFAPCQPVITAGINGKPGLLFKGGSVSTTVSCLVSSLNLPAPGTTPWFCWAVLRQVTFNGANFTAFTGNGTPNVGNIWYGSSAGSWGMYNGSSSNFTSSTFGAFGRLEVYYSNSTSDYVKTGPSSVTGVNCGNASTTGRQIGGQGSNTSNVVNGANIELLALGYVLGLPSNTILTNANNAVNSSAGYGVGSILV